MQSCNNLLGVCSLATIFYGYAVLQQSFRGMQSRDKCLGVCSLATIINDNVVELRQCCSTVFFFFAENGVLQYCNKLLGVCSLSTIFWGYAVSQQILEVCSLMKINNDVYIVL